MRREVGNSLEMKNPLRLLHLIADLRFGGAERIVYELSRLVDREKFEVRVCCLSDRRGGIKDWLEQAGITVCCLDMRHKADLPRLLRLGRLINEWKPDIIQSHMFHSNIAARVIGKPLGVPLVISTAHLVEFRFRPWHRWIDRNTMGLCDAVVSVSQAVQDFVRDQVRVPAHLLRVIRNGIDVHRYRDRSRREETRAGLGVSAHQKLLGGVGRLDRQKGFEYLIEAMALVRREYPDCRLVIIGEGPQRPELERRIEELGLSSVVKLLGFQPNVPDLLSAFDVFCFPSVAEGLPLALCEAMAASLPTVASDIPPNAEVAREGETALLVPPGQPELLAHAILRLLRDDALAERLSRAAVKVVREEFSHERMVREYEAFYLSFFEKTYSDPALFALRKA